MVPGAFVKILFPTAEKPRVPGLLHIGYVLGCAAGYAMVAYTTSQPWPRGVPLPAGARVFSAEEAARLNQSRAFVLRLDLLAKVPMTADWFPDILDRKAEIVSVAPARLQEELTNLAFHLLRRRREVMEIRRL